MRTGEESLKVILCEAVAEFTFGSCFHPVHVHPHACFNNIVVRLKKRVEGHWKDNKGLWASITLVAGSNFRILTVSTGS